MVSISLVGIFLAAIHIGLLKPERAEGFESPTQQAVLGFCRREETDFRVTVRHNEPHFMLRVHPSADIELLVGGEPGYISQSG
jgi:hypothetical protein